MIKKTMIALLLAIFCGTSIAEATYPNQSNVRVQRAIVKEKVIQYGDVLKIVGIPVTDLGPEYYYQRSESAVGALTDADIKRIADALADLITKKFAAGAGGLAPATAEAKALTLINGKCIKCHSEAQKDGQLSFVTGDKLALTDLNKKISPANIAWLMFDETFSQKMPKGGPPLSDEEVQTLRDYAKYLTTQERK